MSYRGNTQKSISYFLPFQEKVFETAKSNPEHIIEIFDNIFAKGINGYNIEQFNSYDKYLSALSNISSNEEDIAIATSLCNSISLATLLSMCILNRESMVNFINENFSHFKLNNSNIPDLGFILFKTGPKVNSKVKFERWILFIDNSSKIPSKDLKELLQKIYQSITKNLTAGKAGIEGMKLNDENSYNPPSDAMNDIMKLLETIISECQSDKLYYGIECNANNYYNEADNTYEMDGFKKPPLTEELIDFYIKLCQDHPLLKYLEDPIANKDERGWGNLLEKFKNEKPDVKISCKSLINDNIINLSNIIDKKEEEGEQKMNTLNPLYRSRLINNEPRPSDIVYEMTELEKKKKEEEEIKKKQEEEEKKRLEEEEEQRRLEEEEMNNKGKKKPPEPKKEVKKKTEEELQKEKEEAEANLPPPFPLNDLNNISLNLGNFRNINELVEIIQKIKSREFSINIYDNINESEQSAISDIGVSFRLNKIILHGLTIKPNKMMKMIKYLELIEELY